MTFPPPPLDMHGAAQALGISRRTLHDVVKGHQNCFEWRGNKRVFYPEHIETLRREMHRCGSKSRGETDGRTSRAQAPMVSALGALSELKILVARKKRGQR